MVSVKVHMELGGYPLVLRTTARSRVYLRVAVSNVLAGHEAGDGNIKMAMVVKLTRASLARLKCVH